MFNILLDPPYWHHSSLKSHMDNLFLIVLDQGHADYCKKYYGPLKDVERAYMLGPVKELKSYEEKEIDILFTGTFNYEYLDLKKTEKKIFSVCGSEDISRKLFDLEKLDMLPAQINTLLNNQTKAKSIAYAGYLKVCSDFTWESFVKKIYFGKS